MTSITKDDHYSNTIEHLKTVSKSICADNQCTEDEHNCDSNAYFDYDKDYEYYHLIDVCISDYRTKCDDSYLPLPIPEDYTIKDLVNDLEMNDIRE